MMASSREIRRDHDVVREAIALSEPCTMIVDVDETLIRACAPPGFFVLNPLVRYAHAWPVSRWCRTVLQCQHRTMAHRATMYRRVDRSVTSR